MMSVPCEDSSHAYNEESPEGPQPNPRTPIKPRGRVEDGNEPTAQPKTASRPAPKITSAPSLEHILVSPTAPINKPTSDFRVGSTTLVISGLNLIATKGRIGRVGYEYHL